MKSILKYILLISIRDRLYSGLFITLITSFSLAVFLGSATLIEQQQTSLAYIAGSSRAILAIGMILFVCLNISRAFENKEVEFIISKAISRQQFILGYLAGFFIIAFLVFIPLIAAILIITDFVNKTGLLFWALSLFLELMIIISFAFLSSLILKNSFTAIMASFSFYIISRLMGVFVLAIQLPQNFIQIKNNFPASGLKFFSIFFPRLDLFGQSRWLNYGISADFGNFKIILLQSLIYIPLMIFMAFHDFKKKQF
jgi:ABC-type transport system involved in multi-copper enzyme maturation permease subunit